MNEKKLISFPYHPFVDEIDNAMEIIKLKISELTIDNLKILKKGLEDRKRISDNILSSGLLIDKEYNVFINPKYGAFFYNTSYESIEEVIHSCQDMPFLDYHCFAPKDVLSTYLSLGYEFVIGPYVKIFDDDNDSLHGVYCTNYNKTLEKSKYYFLK